jgi:hypothetical protein
MDRFAGLDVCGADIVCYCPPLDNPGQITALTSSALLLHLVSLAAHARVRAQGGSRDTTIAAGSRAA